METSVSGRVLIVSMSLTGRTTTNWPAMANKNGSSGHYDVLAKASSLVRKRCLSVRLFQFSDHIAIGHFENPEVWLLYSTSRQIDPERCS